MGDAEDSTKTNFGRRSYDMDCQFHTEQFESLQADVSKNIGKYTSMMWFLGVIGAAIGGCLIVLINKTTAIESLLSDNKIAIVQHTEQIITLKRDVELLQKCIADHPEINGKEKVLK